jgi:hypothetical protein
LEGGELLYLIERDFETSGGAAQAEFESVKEAVGRARAELIEVQVSQVLGKVYFVVELDGPADRIEAELRAANLPFVSVAPVRLVGADLEQVKQARGDAQYLVEWDLPSELSMDAYLTRKREKAPLYANVPEVKFLRTYVREDMLKCLCLYNGPDEEAIRRAREAVSTPISRLGAVQQDQPAIA